MSKFTDMDAQIQARSKGIPFSKCGCGASIPGTSVRCNECQRILEIGGGVPDREAGPGAGRDTQLPQSYPSGDHSGYSDTIPSGKVKRERV